VASPAPRTIVSAVRAFARRHDIFRPGPIVLAVSGGTDSVALALIIAELRDEFGLVLHVAHFDHRARPRSSAQDAAFVAEIAARIDAPIRVGRAERAPESEDEARHDRYEFLRRAAGEIGAAAIATGHTLDDQAETVLLHLTRGSGIPGLAAMRPSRDGVVRPLLAIGRAETAAICAATKIAPREDPTNRSLRFARNRVRLRVLPELEHLNPQVRAALARFADAAAELEPRTAALRQTTAERKTIASAPPAGELDVRSLPPEDARRGRVLAEAWRAATTITLSSRHRDALMRLVSSTSGTQGIDLPGGRAVREYARLLLPSGPPPSSTAPSGPSPSAAPSRSAPSPAPATSASATPNSAAAAPLERGKAVRWHGWRIALDLSRDGMAYSGLVDSDTASHLVVRARRPGDRVPGRGKLQDIFVDAKVPARLRDSWPIFALDEAVLWVPGLTPAPRTGRIRIGADPVADPSVPADAPPEKYLPERQVASKSEARRQGGKRGRR
jgi:tRNA(Ile)-lysidine synthase